MSEFIPFDFGQWRGRLACPKHGTQEGGMALRVQPTKDSSPLLRKYCGLCIIELLDSITHPMTERDEK